MTSTRAAFRAWCLGYSGCSGGDWGSPARPSTWVCGIEPGGVHSLSARALAARVRAADERAPPPGYADWRTNLAHSFTRRIAKLLTALAGEPVANYRDFAERQRLFSDGARGYCRLNLYPVGFADTDPGRWSKAHARVTGFAGKADYLDWCGAQRLPRFRDWARRHRPRLVVGLGKTWHPQFAAAFMAPGAAFTQEAVAGKPLLWAHNAEGALVAVLPFLTSPSGLQSDAAIQAFGTRLRALLDQPSVGATAGISSA